MGDVFRHELAGGGGWGDPLDRDPTLVLKDVLDELVILPVSVLTPVQVSFQLFQTVPRFKSNTPCEARFVNVSYTFGKSTLNSGCVSVSNHSSLSGLNAICPT